MTTPAPAPAPVPVKKPQDVWWRRLLRAEPVLIGTAVPVLTTVGVITATQGNAVATVIAAVVQVAAAFGIRANVTPSSKKGNT